MAFHRPPNGRNATESGSSQQSPSHAFGLASSTPSSFPLRRGNASFNSKGKGRDDRAHTTSNPSNALANARSLDDDPDGSFPTDGGDDSKAEARSARFNTKLEGNRFDQMRILRETERAVAISTGAIQDPLAPQVHSSSSTFKGTCTEMCPPYEREEREAKFNVDKWELRDGTTNRIDSAKAVKMYHRPAAGNEQALPSDVRTPYTLRKTLDYLFTNLLSQDPSLKATHSFIRDRTRSIRQDFTVQSEKGQVSIESHERMARYHIHALHMLCGTEGFSVQQEMEQLRKILTSLTQFYADNRDLSEDEAVPTPYEPEFAAYLLLTHLWDSDILRQTESLPFHLFWSTQVQTALLLAYRAQRSNDPHPSSSRSKPNSLLSQEYFARFFRDIEGESVSYLAACLVESHFGDVRKAGLIGLKKGLLKNMKFMPVGDLVEMLGCDDEVDVAEVCEEFGLKVNWEGETPVSVELHRDAVIVDNRPAFHQRHSRRVVDAKREGWTNIDIINGLAEPASSSAISPSRAFFVPPPTFNAPVSLSQNSNGSSSSTTSTSTPYDRSKRFFPRIPSPLAVLSPVFPTTAVRSPSISPAKPIFPSIQQPVHKVAPLTQLSPRFPTFPSSTFPSTSPSTLPIAPAPSNKNVAKPRSPSDGSRSRQPISPQPSASSCSPSPFNASASAPNPPSVPYSFTALSGTSSTPLAETLASTSSSSILPPLTTSSISASTISNLASTLLFEATESTITNAAHHAHALVVQEADLLASARLRAIIDHASTSIASELLASATEAIAKSSVADEQCRRWLARRTWRKMRDAEERRKQLRIRREKFRGDISSMGVGVVDLLDDLLDGEGEKMEEREAARSSGAQSRGSLARSSTGRTVEQRRLIEVAENRKAFWQPSTYLQTLTSHLSHILPSPHDESFPSSDSSSPRFFDALLSSASGHESKRARDWLRSKLGLEEGNLSTVEEANGVRVRVGDKSGLFDSEDLGLLVYEVDSSSTSNLDSDLARLDALLAFVPDRNIYLPHLLVVSWSSSLESQERLRRLRLSDLPPHIGNSGILYLDTIEADKRFASTVRDLLQNVLFQKVSNEGLDRYLSSFEPICSRLMEAGLEVLGRISFDNPSLISTMNQLLEALNDLSARVLGALEGIRLGKEIEQAISFPSFAPSGETLDARSVSLALREYLDLSRFDGEIDFAVLKADVRSAVALRLDPPIREFLEVLARSLFDRLREVPKIPVFESTELEDPCDLAMSFERATVDPLVQSFDGILTQLQAELDARPQTEETSVIISVNHMSTPSKRRRSPEDDEEEAGRSTKSVFFSWEAGRDEEAGVESKLAKLRRLMEEAKGIL